MKPDQELLRAISLKALFQFSPNALASLDANYCIVDINKAFSDLFGYCLDEIKGKHIDVVMNMGREGSANPDLTAMILAGAHINEEGIRYNKDGKPMDVIIKGFPVLLEGKLVGAYAVYIDISKHKKNEELIRETEKRNRAILNSIPDLMFIYDRKGTYLDFHASDKALLAAKPEVFLGKTVHDILPTDIAEKTLKCFDKLYKTGQIQIMDYKLELPNGLHYFETRLTIMDEERILTVVRDITDRKQAEETLRLRLQYEHLLAKISSLAVNIENLAHFLEKCLSILGQGLDLSRVYIFEHNHDTDTMNNTHEWCAEGIEPQQEKLQGIPAEAVPWWFATLSRGDLICFSDIKDVPDPGAREILSSQGIVSIIVLPLFLDQKYRRFIGFDDCSTHREWYDEDVAILSAICRIIDDVNHRLQSEKKLRHLSFHDQLTGLYNRHFLEEEMQRLDTERQLPISIIMADLNGLKLVNDTYGHHTGDEILKGAAEILKKICRGDDLLARLGGDEFVLYLPHTPEKEARKISERIKKACHKEKINDVPLSLSTGVAVKVSAEQKLSDLLREAEDNMYQDKLTESHSGKNAFVSSLLQTLAAKSFETEAHTRKMQEAAKNIGEKLGLPDSEMHRLSLLITLHDIGKINIPEELITKKGSLSATEWEIIKKHSETGYRIAKATDSFAHVAADILAHHERWDGTGYPQGLKESGIPLLARIVAIADAFEVMSQGRPYKKAMSRSEITAEYKRCSGTQFDPELVKIFLSVLEADG